MGAMTRATLIIAAIALLCSTEAATLPPVTFESPCECQDNHGKHRWSVKIDPSTPTADASAIKAVMPSDMFSWPGPDVRLTQQSERTGIENKWFALTGRVVALKVETDADIHIALQDATGDKPGIVVVEIPVKPQWCEIRNTVLIGTNEVPFSDCNWQLAIRNWHFLDGVLAQLVERLNGIEEVRGSNPLGSKIFLKVWAWRCQVRIMPIVGVGRIS
jgi:hypothetical protein